MQQARARRRGGWLGRLLAGLLAFPAIGAPPPARAEPPGAPPETAAYPHVSFDVDTSLFAIGSVAATDANRRGFSGFVFGHINPGLHLTPEFSVQLFLHPDPAGPVEPNGAITFLRRQNVILEQLFAEWRPGEGTQLYAGKFNAPFGYGHEAFPGVLAAFRAHQVYLIREQIGFGANQALPLPPALGEHTLSFAVFTLDTTSLANSLIVRQRCCDPGFDRYVRTTLRQGGAGNDERLDNLALALEGAEMPALPGLTYNLGLLSRGPGKGGTAREFAWLVGLRHDHAWSETVRSHVFGEFVEFRNADGNPVEATSLGEVPVAATRRFSTLGAQLAVDPWRATLLWQRDAYRRAVDPVPPQNWVEVSLGRALGGGFDLDAGYQYERYVQDSGGTGESHSLIARLRFRFTR